MKPIFHGALCAGGLALGAASVEAVPIYQSQVTSFVCVSGGCSDLPGSTFEFTSDTLSSAEIATRTITELRDVLDNGETDGGLPVSTEFTYSGRAQASASGLKASTFGGLSVEEITPDPSDVLGSNASYQIDARARMSDTLSITGAPNLNHIQFDVDIDGTVTEEVNAVISLSGSGIFFEQFADPDVGNYDLTIQSGDLIVNSGLVDINLQLDILQGFTIEGILGSPSFNGLMSGVDFFNTVTIGQIRGFDASGQLVDLSSAVGSGGHVFDTLRVISPVSEPSIFALLSIGLIGLIAGTKQRRFRATDT